jgi:hypothetical protein
VLIFLNSLFHKSKGLSYNFPIQLQFNFFPLNFFVLLLDLDWEKIHHIIVLVDFLKLLSLQMFNISHLVQLGVKFLKLLSVLLFVLIGQLLQFNAPPGHDGHLTRGLRIGLPNVVSNVRFILFAQRNL